MQAAVIFVLFALVQLPGNGAGSGSRQSSLLMARVKANSLLNDLRGKVGPFVVREVGKQTIVSLGETKKRRKSASPQLAQNRQRMREANVYAKQAMRDPALKAHRRSLQRNPV